MCGCLPSTLNRFPTNGRPGGPGGKLAAFLFFRKSAIKRKTNKNTKIVLRSKLVRKLRSHMVKENERSSSWRYVGFLLCWLELAAFFQPVRLLIAHSFLSKQKLDSLPCNSLYKKGWEENYYVTSSKLLLVEPWPANHCSVGKVDENPT